MATRWYRTLYGQKDGPFDAEQLRSLAASGELQPDDLVWKDGLDDWMPARKVKGLFADAPPPVPDSRFDDVPPVPDPISFSVDRPVVIQSSGGSKFGSGFFGTFGVLGALIVASILGCGGCIALVRNMHDSDEQDRDGVAETEPVPGDVVVTMTRVEIGRPQLKDLFGNETEGEEDQLIATFTVRNISGRRIVRFTDSIFSNDAFTLVDDAGNTIRSASFGSSTVVGAMNRSNDFNPGDETTHIEVFEVPPSATKYLILTVDLERFSSSGEVTYRIESDDIHGFLPE